MSFTQQGIVGWAVNVQGECTSHRTFLGAVHHRQMLLRQHPELFAHQVVVERDKAARERNQRLVNASRQRLARTEHPLPQAA